MMKPENLLWIASLWPLRNKEMNFAPYFWAKNVESLTSASSSTTSGRSLQITVFLRRSTT